MLQEHSNGINAAPIQHTKWSLNLPSEMRHSAVSGGALSVLSQPVAGEEHQRWSFEEPPQPSPKPPQWWFGNMPRNATNDFPSMGSSISLKEVMTMLAGIIGLLQILLLLLQIANEIRR